MTRPIPGGSNVVSLHAWMQANRPQQPALPFEESTRDVLLAFRRWGTAAGHSDRTITEREKTVLRVAHECSLADVDGEQLVDWISRLRNPRTGLPATRSTKATYRAQLRAFFGWMRDTGRRDDDPTVALPQMKAPRGVPRPFTPPQVSALTAACSDFRAHQTLGYVLLGGYAGLRNHEIAKVRGEDFAAGVVRVTGKGGVTLDVPLHPLIVDYAQRMPNRGFWFPSDSRAEGHVSRVSVGNAITRAIERAGITGTPHQLRHHFGTQVLRSSRGDLRLAQRALRHASPATTALYTLVADEDLFNAIDGIGGHYVDAAA